MISLSKSALLVLCIVSATPAFAESAWDRHHPRRDQINDRIAHQERRITQERREGEISRGQAQAMRGQLAGIRAQERFDARFNRGHITRYEQRQLNRELNYTSREIGR